MRFVCIDQGIFAEFANSLSQNGKHDVVYIPNWTKSHPTFVDNCVGENFEHLNKQNSFYNEDKTKCWLDWADCIVNPDVFDNDWIQIFKKMYPNKSIFGSGMGEVLEDDRWKLKKVIAQANLPLQKSFHVKGIELLRKLITEKPGKYIKINIFRGDMESFFAKDIKSIEGKLHKLETLFGPLANEVEFVVEDVIDTDVEIGCDCFFNGIDYLPTCFMGYEYHKFFYLGKVMKMKDIPAPIKETMTALKPTLQKMDYRGALSTEEKIVSPKEHYFLDICSRLMNPGGICYGEWIKNLPEVVYKIGRKEMVDLACPDQYVGCILLDSKDAEDEFVYIDVKPENKDKIKIFCPFQTKNGSYYQVKGCPSTIVVTATGNSSKDVVDKLKKYSELVDASGLNKDVVNEMDVMYDIIEKGKTVGISIF